MKFRYYVTDLHNGSIRGTDDLDAAESFAESEDYFVVDTGTGEWIQPEGIRDPVKEV